MASGASIVIVDDAPEVRRLTRTALRLTGRFTVVGEAADGGAAVQLAAREKPQLMLLDVSMPVMDGLDALPRILAASPATCVVMYSGFEDRALASRAVELGARGFVAKSASTQELVDALTALLTHAPDPAAAGPAPDPPADEREPGDRGFLGEHLERFREVFEQAAIGMATMTLNGHLVRSNRALAELVGRSVADLVGERYADVVHDDALDATLLGGIRARPDLVTRLEHDVAGTGRRVQVTLAPVRDSGGRALYVFLQMQDVTSQRGIEEELRRSEERFRFLVDAVQDYAIFMLTPQGVVASWNAGAQRIKGYRSEEIVGRHFGVFYPPEKRQGHPEQELRQALREGRYEEEGWRVRKDGTRFWANVVLTPVHDDHGRHIGFAKVTRDITERRRADEALRQSEERFRLLVEAVQDYAIFMLDPSGHIASWNEGAQRIKGYTADEMIGRHFRVFYPPDKQADRHPEHELEWALTAGHYEEEGWRIRKDGTRFWANVVITALHDQSGRHVGFTKVTQDRTERRRILDRLESANERLESAAREQAQFLAVTAHELRMPVGVMAGAADILAAHSAALTDQERLELFGSIGAGAARLRRLLGDLLTASRLDAGTVELTMEPLALATIVHGAVGTVRQVEPDADVRVTVPADATVYADRDRVAQVVENLILNGVRHGGSPVLVEGLTRESMVEIRVSDAGAGVSAEMRPRLFRRFATGQPRSGTGLGLFIVRELARAQGGNAFYEPGDPGGHSGAFVVLLRPAAGNTDIADQEAISGSSAP